MGTLQVLSRRVLEGVVSCGYRAHHSLLRQRPEVKCVLRPSHPYYKRTWWSKKGAPTLSFRLGDKEGKGGPPATDVFSLGRSRAEGGLPATHGVLLDRRSRAQGWAT